MLSCRNMSNPSRPRFCKAPQAAACLPANSAREKCNAMISSSNGRLPPGLILSDRIPLQGDQRNIPPVVLAAVEYAAPVTEKSSRFGAGIAPETLDAPHPGAGQAMLDIAFEVELE